MAGFSEQAQVDALLARLGSVGWKERESVKEELATLVAGIEERTAVVEHLENAMKQLSLEARWEVEEILEALAPPPAPEPEEEDEAPEEEPGEPGQLRMSDLDLVYDDPRGLMLYKHKTHDRWFAVQPDPATGQPRMFELHPSEIEQLRVQLKGSPYWVLGAGA